jgi:hypothetical protein
MGQGAEFIRDHAVFWIAIYALGIVTWSCIWRGFVLVTEWAVRACALVTPRYVRPVFLPLVAFFWLYWFVRPAFYVASLLLGIAPRGISG